MDTGNTQTPVWKFSARAQALTGSAIRDIVKKIGQRPDVISFAGGLPSPATFPIDAIRAAFDAVLTREGKAALQYSATDGYAPLRAWIAGSLSTHGARITPEQVLITSGSQQGLDLLGKVLVNEGDRVLVETPTYVGALHALGIYGPRFVSVPMDDDGLAPDALPDLMRAPDGAAFLYTIPTFQNPTGRTLAHERRVALVEQAARLKLLVVDDDPYRLLDHAGRTFQTLLSMDAQRSCTWARFPKYSRRAYAWAIWSRRRNSRVKSNRRSRAPTCIPRRSRRWSRTKSSRTVFWTLISSRRGKCTRNNARRCCRR